MSATSMMRNTCTIKRGTNTTSGGGTDMKTYAAIATGVTCSIQTTGGGEREFETRLQGYTEYSIYFPAATDVVAGDRLTAFAGGNMAANRLSTQVLEVTSTAQDHAGLGAYLMVTATEVNA